jgi:hypothetical protein
MQQLSNARLQVLDVAIQLPLEQEIALRSGGQFLLVPWTGQRTHRFSAMVLRLLFPCCPVPS